MVMIIIELCPRGTQTYQFSS